MPDLSYATRRADRPQPSAPFAAMPHDVAADPRLSPTDVRVLLALLFYARDKPSCWPSDPSIAGRIGRSVGTVQRALRRLCELGLIERRPADNRTNREISLVWRRRSTPLPLATETTQSPARDEGRNERERERPVGLGMGGPSRPVEEGEGETEPSADDLAQLEQWATGPDPALARIAKAALATAGVRPAVVDPPAPAPVPAPPASVPDPSPRVARDASPTPERPITPACPSVVPRATRAVPSPRGDSIVINDRTTTACIPIVPPG